MPRSTADIAANPNPSILIIGDSGTHKTWFAGSCPKPYIFDFDAGVSILRDVPGVEYDTFKDAPQKSKAVSPEHGIYKWGSAWPAFINRLNEIGETIDKGTCPYLTLSLDSVTTMADICMNYVLFSDSPTYTGGIQVQHWGSQIQLLSKVFDQLSSWPLIKVVTAHIQRNTNDLTQVTEMLPLITGKLAGKMPIYFDEVYYTTVGKGEDGKRIFKLTTEGTSMMKQAKSRFGVPDGTEAKWSAVAPFLGKAA